MLSRGWGLGCGGPGLALSSPSGFLLDWHSLRVGGLICAGTLCALGIIILLSERRGRRAGWWVGQDHGLSSPDGPLSPDRWEMQMQVQPEAQVRWVPGTLPVSSCWTDTFQG